MSSESQNGNEQKKNGENSSDIVDFRVWKQKQNLYNENITGTVTKSVSKIKNYKDALNEEEKNDRKKKISYQSTDKLKDKNKKDNLLSDNVKKIMSDVGRLVMGIKTEETDMFKKNIESLLKTTKEIKKSEILGKPNTILKIKEKEYKLALEGKIKKSPNYKFLSDCYRKQVNKAFVDYNPMIHLSNMHMIRQQDPEIEKEFQSRVEEIDKQLKVITASPNLYKDQNKKYSKIYREKNLNKNISSVEEPTQINVGSNKSVNILSPFISSKDINYNNSVTYTEPTGSTEGLNTASTGNQAKNIFIKKIRNKKKPEVRRKFPNKDIRVAELNLMYNACKKLENVLDDQRYNDYIDCYKDLKDTDINQQKHVYFGDIDNTQRILTEIQETLHTNNLYEDIRNKKKQITNESDKLVDDLLILKGKVLNEIDEQEKKESKYMKIK